MPVDRDDHWRPLASTERLHDLGGNFQPPHGLWWLDVGSKLHAPLRLRSSGIDAAAGFTPSNTSLLLASSWIPVLTRRHLLRAWPKFCGDGRRELSRSAR